HNNPFVTGAREWQRGHKNSREGLLNPVPSAQQPSTSNSAGPIHGNRNSKIYHLPQGCPSYNAMKEHNKVLFNNEEEALAAGYRKAGNCRQLNKLPSKPKISGRLAHTLCITRPQRLIKTFGELTGFSMAKKHRITNA